ncbi:acyl-ACP dehydrogenase MbtN [Actinomadura alba]
MPGAESDRKFPVEAVGALGLAGLFRERWSQGQHGDLGRSVVIAEEFGRAALGGVGVGVGLHLEAAVPLLRGFARTEYARKVFDHAMDGRYVCCVATSEREAGSNLAEIGTKLSREGAAWRLRGTKWFVSPGGAADVVIVLCRTTEGPALVLVPREGVRVVKRLETMGMRGLETCRLAFDTEIPDEAILVRPGMALHAIGSALIYERLSTAALMLGALDLALLVTATHLRRRKQFGVPLYEHQALRLRLADLIARTALARRGVHATVAEFSAAGVVNMCEVAGVKVTVARLAEHVASECAHLFGGHGYVEDETRFPQLLRDIRVGRVGGGTDEMMWELAAKGMRTDDALYDRWVRS